MSAKVSILGCETNVSAIEEYNSRFQRHFVMKMGLLNSSMQNDLMFKLINNYAMVGNDKSLKITGRRLVELCT